ncbi:MAG TPA: GTP-binding protein [Candidatus Nanoarchaeia archaeon]|nr:GTP-binding protein [Candidatus Nanoarchaeia archaeon]
MADYDNEIKKLEDEISTTKYNKRTQHAIGLLKAKLARLKERQDTEKRGKKKGEGYAIKRSGDATVIIVGFPSVGKSTLLNALTNAKSQTADYAFTTLSVIPGILEHEQAKIQLLDVPGMVEGASDGTGRGREVLSVLQSVDMVIILVDINHPGELKIILDELHSSNIRLNQHKPDVRIRKTVKNGIRIGKTVRLPFLSDDTIKAILKEFRINNAEVLIREAINDDQLIDVIEANRIYMPAVIALNKADTLSLEQAQRIKEQLRADAFISAEKNINLEELKKLIFARLGLIRVYLKQPGKEADLNEPLIMRRNPAIRAVCEKLHKDFVSRFRFARIWGSSSRFPGQKILSLNHVLQDKDVLELHLR